MRTYTIVETPTFVRLAAEIWREAELMEFRLWLAGNPLAGDVIPGAGGLRKVRWSRPGMGKRGGARVVYYNLETAVDRAFSAGTTRGY